MIQSRAWCCCPWWTPGLLACALTSAGPAGQYSVALPDPKQWNLRTNKSTDVTSHTTFVLTLCSGQFNQQVKAQLIGVIASVGLAPLKLLGRLLTSFVVIVQTLSDVYEVCERSDSERVSMEVCRWWRKEGLQRFEREDDDISLEMLLFRWLNSCWQERKHFFTYHHQSVDTNWYGYLSIG